jgi:hypothetical protein
MAVTMVSPPDGLLGGFWFCRMRMEVKVPCPNFPLLEVNLNFTSRLPPESTIVLMDFMVSCGLEELLLLQDTTAAAMVVITKAGNRKDASFMMLI